MIDANRCRSCWNSIAVAIVTAVFLIGCGADHSGPTDPTTPVVATVQVTGSTDTVGVGDTVAYTASAATSTGKPVLGIQFRWVSSDTAVARVDPKGHAIFLAPGLAVITANAVGPAVNVPSSVAGARTLTVKNFIRTVALSLVAGNDTVAMGDTIRFAAVARNGSDVIVSGAQFVWSVSDTSIAHVDASGLVTAQAMGVVEVTAVASGPSGIVRPGIASGSTPIHVRLVLESISGGGKHVCGVALGGIVYCWGKASWGELGNGASDVLAVATTPVRARTSDRFLSVSAAPAADDRGGHTCGITVGGALDCWGSGAYGVLGTGSHGEGLPPYFVDTPLQVGVGPFSAAAGGGLTTCALTSAGDTYCAGSNLQHQLGVDTVTDVCGQDFPGQPVLETCSTKFVRVSAAPSFKSITQSGGTTCGLTSAGKAWCWGSNNFGNAGVGYATSVASPAPVVGGIAFTMLSAGVFDTCGITSDGTAYCSGYNLFGGIGNGTSTIEPITVPTAVASSSAFTSISVGLTHACALTAVGDAYCWGLDQHGELGAPATDVCGPPYQGVVASCSPRPVQVQNVPRFIAITAGFNFTCGLTSSGSAYCWGTSQDGELGNGTSGSDSATPVHVTDVL